MGEYIFDSVEDYEKSTGIIVDDAFRIGWDLARIKKPQNDVEPQLKKPEDIGYGCVREC